MLRLELALLERPGRFPMENEARRGDGGSIGSGDAGGGEGAEDLPRSNAGMSASATLANEIESARQRARTTLNFVQFGIVAYVGRLWFSYLHLAILLQLREREIGLVPLQATSGPIKTVVRSDPS